ncbi:MAG: hypothetical protein HY712_07870 [candidate division NC10 bacterium]|nr:hypothetical protein [candidate division NC10 bacterium]
MQKTAIMETDAAVPSESPLVLFDVHSRSAGRRTIQLLREVATPPKPGHGAIACR